MTFVFLSKEILDLFDSSSIPTIGCVGGLCVMSKLRGQLTLSAFDQHIISLELLNATTNKT